MSLDIWLTEGGEGNRGPARWAIFIHEDGATREISLEEWNERFPGQKPVLAQVGGEAGEVFSANITHNLNKMAEAAGIYMTLWRPEEIGIERAEQMIEQLEAGLAKLKADPAHYETFNSPNGWGLYEHFVPLVERVLNACREHPTATVGVWR